MDNYDDFNYNLIHHVCAVKSSISFQIEDNAFRKWSAKTKSFLEQVCDMLPTYM